MRLTTSALTRTPRGPTRIRPLADLFLLIGAWTLFFWPSPLKLILLVAFVLVAMLIVAGDSER